MERLTARNKNNIAYLVKVKPNEQEVESSYPNTLNAILECFERLAEYEDTGLLPDEITQLQANSKEKTGDSIKEVCKVINNIFKDSDLMSDRY
jgi:hypothetical protein